MTVAVPFADVTRLKARFFQETGDSDFLRPQMHRAAGRNPVVDAVSIRNSSSQEPRAGGRTDRGCGVAVRESNPVRRELIQMRCPDVRMPVASDIAVAEIIAKYDNKIRQARIRRSGCTYRERRTTAQAQQGVSKHR